MSVQISSAREPWNKGKIVGQKAPFKLKEIWAIRIRLQLAHKTRELALFNLGIDSELRACDLIALHVRDICHGDRISARAIILQRKTHCPVQFEITEQTRQSVEAWMREASLRADDFLFPKSAPLKSFVHAPIRPHRSIVGDDAGTRRIGVWHTLDAKNQGVPDLSSNEESSGSPAPTRSYKT